ncbi:MAG: histidinol dehydrogenase [Desulfobacterales bacterium]
MDNFIKKTSLIQYTKKAFQREAPNIIRLAEVEGLTAHARSIKVRL